jgi:hypothetical protein
MGLTTGESTKGWMGQLNKAIRALLMERTQDRGY